jgi:hypothetical protein
MRAIDAIFAAKALQKPGGSIYRSIASLPKHISEQVLTDEAHRRGYGYRVEHGKIVIFSRA